MLLEPSALSEDDLKKAADFMLTPKALQHRTLARARFRIYEGMFVSYKRHPCTLVECYHFEFTHSHQMIGAHSAANLRSQVSGSLVLSAQEIRELLALSAELSFAVMPLVTQFAQTKLKFTLPPDTDLEFYQTKVSRLMTIPDRGLFAPIFSSLTLHADIKILFNVLADNPDVFRVTCLQSRSPVIELAKIGEMSKGHLTQFQERPGKYYLCFDNGEAFAATCLALPQYFCENIDYRIASRKHTFEIMGCLLDFYPDITPHILLSKKQIIALGKAYTLGLHHGTLLESSSGKRFLHFSQLQAKVFQEICEKIGEALEIKLVIQGEGMIEIAPEIASILNDIFDVPAKPLPSLR